MSDSRFLMSQFGMGGLDGMVILSSIFFMSTKGHYVTGIVGIIVWLCVRSYAHDKGITPYPWDGPEWNKEDSPTVCPDCGAEITTDPRQYICSNYPDCEYVGKGVIPDE